MTRGTPPTPTTLLKRPFPMPPRYPLMTVGQLRKALEHLPPTLPVLSWFPNMGYGDSCDHVLDRTKYDTENRCFLLISDGERSHQVDKNPE